MANIICTACPIFFSVQEIDAEVTRRCEAYEAERVTDDLSRLQQLQKVRNKKKETGGAQRRLACDSRGEGRPSHNRDLLASKGCTTWRVV